VVANGKGLFIRDMRAEEPVEVSEGYRLSSLAPWLYLREKWGVPGDFSLPPLKEHTTYAAAKGDPEKARVAGLLHR
jgi:hypothetical protein